MLSPREECAGPLGQPLRKTALLESLNVIQWCLYYPAVVDSEELRLSEEERRALSRSLAAYQAGDLVAALEAYPQDRQPGSDAERVYLAALRVAFGQLREAEELIEPISPQAASAPLAGALRRLRAAVRGPQESLNLEHLSPTVQSASVLLAESYRLQSLTNLPAAWAAASQSANLSPNFSFAWARVAELEFSFGRTRQASEAIEKALQFARETGFKKVYIETMSELQQAMSVYEKFGFEYLDGPLGQTGHFGCKVWMLKKF